MDSSPGFNLNIILREGDFDLRHLETWPNTIFGAALVVSICLILFAGYSFLFAKSLTVRRLSQCSVKKN